MNIIEYSQRRTKPTGGLSAVLPVSQKEGYIVKIVVIKSPRFLSGILRTIFGIKKDEE
ncbi:MAG: stage V sporulation protein SpoVM [Ruminococcus sp.]|nr:stage V sporulation protein SpoVM [Ruminococcus sp.]